MRWKSLVTAASLAAMLASGPAIAQNAGDPAAGVSIILTRKTGEPVVIATTDAAGHFLSRVPVARGDYELTTQCRSVPCPPHVLTSVSMNGSRLRARGGTYEFTVGPNTRSAVLSGDAVVR